MNQIPIVKIATCFTPRMKRIFTLEYQNDRIYGLDIIRTAAILFVVLGHGRSLLSTRLRNITELFVFDGVSIFFVLSGFLIGGILIKLIEEHGVHKRIIFSFWVRRWYRTLPNYLLVLLLLCILHLLSTDNFSFLSVGSYFFFSQNLFSKQPTWFFPEAWSLSVEEWFYFVIPIVLYFYSFFSKRTSKQVILILSIGTIILITLFRLYRYSTMVVHNMDEWDLVFRRQVVTRMDSLMIGVLGAYFSIYKNRLWIKYKNQLLVVGVLLFFLVKFVFDKSYQVNGLYYTVFSFNIISIATLFLIPYFNDFKTGKGFLCKAITHLSLISYSMYLLNLSVIQFFIVDKIPWHRITNNEYFIMGINYFIYWFLVIFLSTLLYKYFEAPTTRMRDFFRLKS